MRQWSNTTRFRSSRYPALLIMSHQPSSHSMYRCSMTGAPIAPGEGVWDDGEWVSWDYLNGQIYEADEAEILERMIVMAKEYLALTGRHLPIYGEVGNSTRPGGSGSSATRNTLRVPMGRSAIPLWRSKP